MFLDVYLAGLIKLAGPFPLNCAVELLLPGSQIQFKGTNYCVGVLRSLLYMCLIWPCLEMLMDCQLY